MNNPIQSDENGSLLDPEQIQMLMEAGASDSVELFNELLGMFEEESLRKLEDMKASRTSGEFEALGRAAHALAGSSANVGAKAVWKMAKQMENLCKDNQGPSAAAMLEDLEATYHRSMIELKAYAGRMASGSGPA